MEYTNACGNLCVAACPQARTTQGADDKHTGRVHRANPYRSLFDIFVRGVTGRTGTHLSIFGDAPGVGG